MIWNLDEILLAFGLHCLINWILPNCWHSDMFTTISASLRFLLWFCPSLLSVAVISLLVYLNRHAANCHSPMNCTRKIIIIRKRSWQRNRSLSWSLPFLEGLRNSKLSSAYCDKLWRQNDSSNFVIDQLSIDLWAKRRRKRDSRRLYGRRKKWAFFVVRCQFLPRSLP